MKKNIIYIILFIAIISCYNDKTGRRNYENLQRVKIGMSKDSVLIVMGKPYCISQGNKFLTFPKEYIVFSYSNVYLSADDFHIVFDTTGNVNAIVSCH